MIKVEKFKLARLSVKQIDTLEKWLEVCRRTWNMGRALLLEQEDASIVQKLEIDDNGKPIYGCVPRCPWSVKGESCPRPTKPSFIKYGSGDGDWAAHSYILAKERKGGMQDSIRVGACCPLPVPPWREPRLGMNLFTKYTLQYYFTQKNIKALHPHFANDFCTVPAWYIRGVCESLSKAWNEFKKRKRGEPRFKRLSDKMGSLIYSDAKKLSIRPFGEELVSGICRDGELTLPKLGKLSVKWLYHKWGERPITKLVIIKAADAWYLHLTSNDSQNVSKTWSRKVQTTLVVFNNGPTLAIDDRGFEYSPLPKDRKGRLDVNGVVVQIETDILTLQQQISRQERSCRERGVKESNRLSKNRLALAKLQQRRSHILSNSRKKIAHFAAERSGALTVIASTARMIPAPDPIVKLGSAQIHYAPNGRTRVKALNKQRSMLASGEFIALLKSETSERGYNIDEQIAKE